MDSICALFFTLILVFPLVMQLQMLIADPKKLCKIFHYYASGDPEDSIKSPSLGILQHYPKGSTLFNPNNSDSKMLLASLRTASSSPVISNGTSLIRLEKRNLTETRLADARHSSTFVKTDQVIPVVDITWNYSSYRYKTFADCLESLYGGRYPPAEVVLNSLQLNLLDSHTNVALNVAGLFDFVKEESQPPLSDVSRKLEIEYLNPLDHFVAKQLDRPATVERFTETDEEDPRHNAASSVQEDPIVPVITVREKNQPNRRSSRKIETPCKRYLSSSKRVPRDE